MFIQPHRSHVVNMAHISRIERVARNYEITIGKDDFRIPVSRHRIPHLLPALQAFWRPPP